ncbi:MAG: Fic family protein [Pirellulaceae bacterium]|nr:Fic family protein [Pirellulaceae bacterium]
MTPKLTITNAIAAALTRIERARGFLEAATLSEDWIRAMGQRALVLEAHHTTHIEGTQLTLEQAERLMRGESVPEADPDDARELLNYRRAFEFVSEYLDSGAPVTEGLIREIHKRLVEGVRGGSAAPGEYRKVQNYAVNSATGQTVYTPPPAHDVPPLMAEMVTWLTGPGQVHPVLVSGVAQFQLVHIHPFLDGNGRTSRLLSTLCLYRAGYDFKRLFTISEYYDRDRAAFYAAIQGVRECGMDLTQWLEYFVQGLATQLGEVADRGKKAMKADLIAHQHELNERQTKALRFLLGHAEMHVRDLEAMCPGVNRRTLQRDLQQMEDLGLVERKGAASALSGLEIGVA